MASDRFGIGGAVQVLLAGGLPSSGAVASYFARELPAPVPEATSTLTLAVRDDVPHDPVHRFGVTGALDGDRFLVPDGAGHYAVFDPALLAVDSRMQIDIGLCCANYRPTVLLDWLIMPIAHFALAGAGRVPFHASAASLPTAPADPIVFSAWSGVGKTNMVLWALSHGGTFFGDDQVIGDRQGRLHATARRVGVYGYNRELASGLSTKLQLKLRVGDDIHRAARRTRGRAAFLIAYAANGLGSVRVGAEGLGGVTGSVAPVRAHVMCRATLDDVEPRPSDAPRDEESIVGYAAAHAAVMEYEYGWFHRYLQTWRWATSTSRDPWRELSDSWQSNTRAYLDCVPDLLTIDIPRGRPKDVAESVWSCVSARLQTAVRT